MVEYADEYDGDCCRMQDSVKHYIYQTRDVIWLKWMYYLKPTTEPVPDYIIENTIDNEMEAGENIENQTHISTNSDGETANLEREWANTEEIKKFILVTSSTGRVI